MKEGRVFLIVLVFVIISGCSNFEEKPVDRLTTVMDRNEAIERFPEQYEWVNTIGCVSDSDYSYVSFKIFNYYPEEFHSELIVNNIVIPFTLNSSQGQDYNHKIKKTSTVNMTILLKEDKTQIYTGQCKNLSDYTVSQ